MKHFPVIESECSREIIMDIKFHPVRDKHGSKSNLILQLFRGPVRGFSDKRQLAK